jgi:hypothetical protein
LVLEQPCGLRWRARLEQRPCGALHLLRHWLLLYLLALCSLLCLLFLLLSLSLTLPRLEDLVRPFLTRPVPLQCHWVAHVQVLPLVVGRLR